MVFSSVVFLQYFLPILLVLYWLVPRSLKNFLLLAFSLYFYAWGEPVFVWLMLGSILANYLFGTKVQHASRNRKAWLVSAVVFNVGLLGIFKYTNFFLTNVAALLQLPPPSFTIPLPLGISFFTFQAMSYVIDVYRGDAKQSKSLVDVALYVTLFPQLVAGPIVRYQTIAEQISVRLVKTDDLVLGIKQFIIGFAKKIMIANSLGMAADQVFSSHLQSLSVLGAWLGVVCYGLQIYFDFSGYSDMAIGLGRMFGFAFLPNFQYPYTAKSVAEFWRRWHISLGTWFRDYLYIPLGGNRCGTIKQIRNLVIVWFLTGMWHGASWNFIVWGLYFGLFVVLESLVFKQHLEKLPAWIRHIYLLAVVFVGWVFFRSETLPQAISFVQRLFIPAQSGFFDASVVFLLHQYGFELLLAILFSIPFVPWVRSKTDKIHQHQSFAFLADTALYMGILVISIIQMANTTFNPFIYFRF